MSTNGPATEQEIEKLREWVDDLRIPKPPEAPKEPAVHDPRPTQPVLKAPTEIPEQVLRTQKIIAAIHGRREERARLVADGNSKRVAFQRATEEDQRVEAEQIAAWERELQSKTDELRRSFSVKLNGRNWELQETAKAIDKIDVSLEQLRKQLDAELAKLDPERKGGA